MYRPMNKINLNRLGSLISTVKGIEQGRIRTQDGSGRDTTQENLSFYRKEIAKLIEPTADKKLLEVISGFAV
jgi:hypothetical protein